MLRVIRQLIAKRWLHCSSALAALVLILATPNDLRAKPPPINPSLLAEFTVKIARYTTWPKERDFYQIHAVGFDKNQINALANLDGRTIKEKPILVTFEDDVPLSGGQLPEIVLISNSLQLDPSTWCFTEAPVLVIVVNESTLDYCESAVIGLYSARGRIEFEANLSQAKKHDLKLSARMLRLARKVR